MSNMPIWELSSIESLFNKPYAMDSIFEKSFKESLKALKIVNKSAHTQSIIENETFIYNCHNHTYMDKNNITTQLLTYYKNQFNTNMITYKDLGNQSLDYIVIVDDCRWFMFPNSNFAKCDSDELFKALIHVPKTFYKNLARTLHRICHEGIDNDSNKYTIKLLRVNVDESAIYRANLSIQFDLSDFSNVEDRVYNHICIDGINKGYCDVTDITKKHTMLNILSQSLDSFYDPNKSVPMRLIYGDLFTNLVIQIHDTQTNKSYCYTFKRTYRNDKDDSLSYDRVFLIPMLDPMDLVHGLLPNDDKSTNSCDYRSTVANEEIIAHYSSLMKIVNYNTLFDSNFSANDRDSWIGSLEPIVNDYMRQVLESLDHLIKKRFLNINDNMKQVNDLLQQLTVLNRSNLHHFKVPAHINIHIDDDRNRCINHIKSFNTLKDLALNRIETFIVQISADDYYRSSIPDLYATISWNPHKKCYMIVAINGKFLEEMKHFADLINDQYDWLEGAGTVSDPFMGTLLIGLPSNREKDIERHIMYHEISSMYLYEVYALLRKMVIYINNNLPVLVPNMMEYGYTLLDLYQRRKCFNFNKIHPNIRYQFGDSLMSLISQINYYYNDDDNRIGIEIAGIETLYQL